MVVQYNADFSTKSIFNIANNTSITAKRKTHKTQTKTPERNFKSPPPLPENNKHNTTKKKVHVH